MLNILHSVVYASFHIFSSCTKNYVSIKIACAVLHIYIIQWFDVNVEASGCDSLSCTITKFSIFAVLERWLKHDNETE